MEQEQLAQDATGTQFPLPLGQADEWSRERVSEEAYRQMPRQEQELLARLSGVFPARFWDHYRALRGLGYAPRAAVVGAWLAAGAKGRGPYRTRLGLAEALGVSRHTVYRAEAQIQAAAHALVMTWLQERVPDVDAAVYEKAAEGDISAAKLFYQRARVPLSGEEAQPVDSWAEALEAARMEAARIETPEASA